MTATVQPTLATVEQLQARYPEVIRDIDPQVLQETLEEATRHIETRVGRRLAPFVGHIYQDRLFGIDPSEFGADNNTPLSWEGSLGQSMAGAYGSQNLVRHMWLDQFAPLYPELWTYNVQSIQIYRSFGDSQPIYFNNGGILGPDSTDGHIWLRLGTFAPEGTRVQIIYDGGYTVSIPTDLRRACIYQAIKFIILDIEPQLRKDLNLDEIDREISLILGGWVRG
jgi:hypothetical protein